MYILQFAYLTIVYSILSILNTTLYYVLFYLCNLNSFISLTKQFFTFHSNRVKCEKNFSLGRIRTHDLLH